MRERNKFFSFNLQKLNLVIKGAKMVYLNDEKYAIQDNETEEDYELRICSYRETDRLTWTDVASIINRNTDRSYSESHYRKGYKLYLMGLNSNNESEVCNLTNAKIELAKEKVKIADERIQTNAYIRQLAREETIKEIAYKVASEMNDKKMLPSCEVHKSGDSEAILCISDWHYGICCENYWNTYNPEIARARIAQLLERTQYYCKQNNVGVLHVVNIGDAIAGRIHLGLRLESRFDVITQTIEVSEIIAEMLSTLSQDFEIHYYDCLDNHSRLEPNKKDAMDLESLARIIPWYIKTRLNNIQVHENLYGEDIINFHVKGFNILGVHGDKDKPNMVVDSLSTMTHQHYDLMLTAHLHHFSADEKNETLVVSNGSMMGTDTYARNLRLSSKPSQNLIIVSDENVAECIYRIILK